MTNFDKFLGLILDTGAVFRKFGEDMKPIVDRVKEITKIISKVYTKVEGLPEGNLFPMLGDGEKE